MKSLHLIIQSFQVAMCVLRLAFEGIYMASMVNICCTLCMQNCMYIYIYANCAMTTCMYIPTICDNVHHPEPWNDRLAKCTEVLCPHWHCASTVLGESTDGYRGDWVCNEYGIIIFHVCHSSVHNVVNQWPPSVISWFPWHLQDVVC